MTEARITIRGELYLTLAEVARCFAVEVSWVEEAYDLDLLGEGERIDDTIAIAASMLERIAVIRRIQLQQGVNIPGIALLADLLP
jgi:hypothetical protein